MIEKSATPAQGGRGGLADALNAEICAANDGEIPNANGRVAQILTTTPNGKYSVRGAWEIACLDLPPLETIWDGIALSPFAIYGVAGAPGRGKSRVTFDLARHQVLGRDFLGLPTLQRPLKWLIVGSENDIHRLNFEMCRFLFHADPKDVRGLDENQRMQLATGNGFCESEIRLLDANIRPFTLEQPDDCYISLTDENNQRKLTQTMKDEMPDVAVIDPWGDLIAGEELNDADVRATVQILRRCEKDAKISAPCFIVCHARIGANEEAKARGMDEGNFMKNSKCLYSIARYFINVRRASFDDNPPIELVCAKNNNGVKPPPVAGKLNPVTMSYETVADHDADAWQRELENYARTQSGRGGASVRKQVIDIRNDVAEILQSARAEAAANCEPFKGMPKGKLCELVQARFADRNVTLTDKRFRIALTSLVAKTKEIAISEPFDSRREYVGTPDEIAWVKEAKKMGGTK